MARQIGSGYLGSESMETSTGNKEIIPSPPDNWTGRYRVYKMGFFNEDETRISINGGKPIFLQAGQGFTCSLEDAAIYSFVVLDQTRYNWIGAY